ncbi:MAG: PD-(D/E)XK nuclease family protein [Clostridia bacterium]|nr:PD-(D/E)XK nuclease family protein [Clostridia bacterium]
MKLAIYQGPTTFSSAKYMLSKIDNSDFDIDHVVVVPDKFSLLTEKLILDLFPQGSLFNVRVKTLSSLSRELMRKLGCEVEVLSSGESLLLTQEAIERVKKDFVSFKKSNINFCYEISKLISQFKSSCIGPEELTERNKSAAQNKYRDLSLIYSEYQKLLDGKFDVNERMKFLQARLAQSDILSKTKIYFAHFDAFTKEAFSLIKVLFEKAKEVSVSLAHPQSIGNDYIYEKDIQKKFEKVAQEFGVQVDVFMDEGLLDDRQNAIARGLYSYEKVKAANEGYYNVYGASSVAAEVESVAKLIRYLTFKGKRYSDFQIAVGSLSKYQGQLENIFDRYDIPYYIDSSITADKTILGNFILSFFGTFATGYAHDNLIDLFANVLIEQHSLIETAQRMEVDGKNRYKKYLEEEFAFAEQVTAFEQAKTPEQFGKIIKTLCDKTQARYESVLEKIREEGRLKEYNINIQAKEAIDEAVALIDKYGHDEISGGEYLKKLKLLLSFKQVSTVPTYVDAVMVGDATQSGFEEKAILILLGGEELPITASDNGILTDEEMKTDLPQKEIEPTIRMINRRNRFKLFSLLSLAKEQLFLFYQLANEEGKKNELPAYIKSLNGIFSQSVLNCRGVFFSANPTSLDWARLVSGVKQQEGDFSYLYRTQLTSDAESLMLKNNKAKVTQLESYFVCPFKHFATYGLKLKEKDRQFDPRDLGSVCHKMAELFVKLCVLKGRHNQTDVKAFVEKYLLSVLESEGVREKIDNMEEAASLLGFLKKQMISLLKDIVKECNQSLFKPKYTEVKFDNLKLCDKYMLIGKADRIDEYGDYLRVLDYKTGRTGNLIKQLYYGEKLQLFLYQKIVAEKFGKQEGGVFYFNAKFNYNKGDEEGNFVLKGLVDKEPTLLEALDSDIDMTGKSSLTQIYKDEKGYKGAAISPVNLRQLCEYAFKTAEKAATEIAEGYISPKPTADGCQWCPYGAFCGYESALGVRENKDDVEF